MGWGRGGVLPYEPVVVSFSTRNTLPVPKVPTTTTTTTTTPPVPRPGLWRGRENANVTHSVVIEPVGGRRKVARTLAFALPPTSPPRPPVPLSSQGLLLPLPSLAARDLTGERSRLNLPYNDITPRLSVLQNSHRHPQEERGLKGRYGKCSLPCLRPPPKRSPVFFLTVR